MWHGNNPVRTLTTISGRSELKVFPLDKFPPLFSHDRQTFSDLGIRIQPSLEGLTATAELFQRQTKSGLKPLICLEFCWLPEEVVTDFNQVEEENARRKILIDKVWGSCPLNCKGCYAKQDSLYRGQKLLSPKVMMKIIQEAVENLGTQVVKYLGPTEFFRDPKIFYYLDFFQELGVQCIVFVKDPMFGDDHEVAGIFGVQGIFTAEMLIQRLADYPNLKLIYNFRTFDEAQTNYLVRDGYIGKKNYALNYKVAQTRALQLLYQYFVLNQIHAGQETRLIIVNAPVTEKTIDEALEIYRYFVDRGVPVCTTASMESGCGQELNDRVTTGFLEKLVDFYARAYIYAIRRGVISLEHWQNYGPSSYAGFLPCFILCNGLIIRETGQLMRCEGADHQAWQDDITPEQLVREGIVNAWPKTQNYKQASAINVGCLAKSRLYTPDFFRKVKQRYEYMMRA